MKFKELISLYGPAALFASTRLLHQRVQQLESDLQVVLQQREDDREKAESSYKELQERVFIRKENFPPIGSNQEQPLRITKKKATRVRDLIAQKKREETAYYERQRDMSLQEDEAVN